MIIFIWKSLIMKCMCVGSFRPTDCWNKLVCQYLSIFSQIYLFGTLWLMTVLALLTNRSHDGSGECMTVEELEQGKQWLSDTFHLIR